MVYMLNNMTIDEYLEKNLSEKRRKHIYSVVDEAKKLSLMYDGNIEKCETAALFHDMVREISIDEMNNYIKKYNLDEKYLSNRNVAHGKVAAALMKDCWGIDDTETLEAVSYHTTGREGMSKTEKIVFIADAIEPTRNYDGVEKMREATYEDLDKGCLVSLRNTIAHLKDKGVKDIDEDTIKAEIWFKEIIERKEKVNE